MKTPLLSVHQQAEAAVCSVPLLESEVLQLIQETKLKTSVVQWEHLVADLLASLAQLPADYIRYTSAVFLELLIYSNFYSLYFIFFLFPLTIANRIYNSIHSHYCWRNIFLLPSFDICTYMSKFVCTYNFY